ncbi:MAG: hypothetical protein JXR37_09765 [Kiritimatiellae bacterium]|nr:hypothetical protein [Kiritimatiellia bacterium]
MPELSAPTRLYARARFLPRVLAAAGRTAAVVVVLAAVARADVESVEEILLVLEENDVAFDVTEAKRGAVMGLLKAVDPSARIVTPEEAAALQAEIELAEKTALIDKAEEWPLGLRCLKIRGLYAECGSRVAERVAAWCGADALGLVLDLRGAGGNDLASVARIAGLFAAPGTALFSVEGGGGGQGGVRTGDGKQPANMALVVLIDGKTTGAAEILAAVLHELPGVLLLGAATAGDARVREPIPLPGGEQMAYLAARRVVLPSGATCGERIDPDIAVSATAAEAKTPAASSAQPRAPREQDARTTLAERVGGDPVLSRAVDVLLGLRALKIGVDEDANDHSR